MRIIWRLGKASGREIFDASLEERTLDYRTMGTHLRRMADKGYLRVTAKDGKSKYFEARVRKKTVLRQEIDAFMGEVLADEPEAVELLQEALRGRFGTSAAASFGPDTQRAIKSGDPGHLASSSLQALEREGWELVGAVQTGDALVAMIKTRTHE